MTRYILNIHDQFCIYGDTAESPLTYFTDKQSFLNRLKYDQHARECLPHILKDESREDIVEIAKQHGTYPKDTSIDTVISCNQAAPNGDTLNKDELFSVWNLEDCPMAQLSERLLNLAVDEGAVDEDVPCVSRKMFDDDRRFVEFGFERMHPVLRGHFDEEVFDKRHETIKKAISECSGMHLLHDGGVYLAVTDDEGKNQNVDKPASICFQNVMSV